MRVETVNGDVAVYPAESSPAAIPLARADIWPARDRHGLCLLDVTDVRARAGRRVSSLADELASLADASWALDRSGQAPGPLRSGLDAAAGDVLRRLGRELGGDLGLSMAERADAVEAGDHERNMRLTVDCDDHRVVVVYGPLKTWASKDEECRFGALVSLEDPSASDVLGAADEGLPEAVRLVALECDAEELDFWHVPGFVVTDVVAAGGEANTFPKHFALFLPEDAGFDDRDHDTKTIVYGNVYETQFRSISTRLGETLLRPWRPIPEAAVLPTLLVWFRGHDVSHFLGPDGEHVDHLVGLPGTLRGALQEAFADVIGYLLASSSAVLGRAGLDVTDLTLVYLAEMTRYFRRGWPWFPDSYAARLELTYLVDGKWLEIVDGPDGLELHWDPEVLREGMVALGRELCATLVRGDQTSRGWLCHLCEHEPGWLGDFEQRLREQTTSIGDSLVFGHSA